MWNVLLPQAEVPVAVIFSYQLTDSIIHEDDCSCGIKLLHSATVTVVGICGRNSCLGVTDLAILRVVDHRIGGGRRVARQIARAVIAESAPNNPVRALIAVDRLRQGVRYRIVESLRVATRWEFKV